MDEKLIEAFKVLMQESRKRIIESRIHPLDLKTKLKEYDRFEKEFNKSPDNYIDDTVNDITAYFNW